MSDPLVQVEPFVSDELRIEIDESDDRVRCLWTGSSQARDPAAVLRGFLDGVLDLAAAGERVIEMRFEGMTRVNSSTLTTLIAFSLRCCKRSVQLDFVYDASLSWQRMAFKTMAVFDDNEALFTVRSV